MVSISFLYKFFKLKEHNTNIRTEIIAGTTTFLAMSYIIFLNPAILSGTGMDKGAVFTATLLISVLATLLMGLIANTPLALAPGMSTNAWFTYGIVLGMGYSWQVALASGFISGFLIFILSITKLRSKIIDAIPINMKVAITVSIGLFLAFIGLKNAGIIIANPNTLLKMGNIFDKQSVLFGLGFLIIILLNMLRVKGASILSIIVISIAAYFLGISSYNGVFSLPPSVNPVFLKLDFKGLIEVNSIILICSIFLVDFLDNTTTFIGIMGSVSKKIGEKQIKKGLLVDGLSISLGALIGVNPVANYSENTVGVIEAGGRTGLTALTAAILFFMCLFISPLLSLIPMVAVSPVLLYTGFLMFSNIEKLKFGETEEVIPAFIVIILTVLTFSMINGIGIGMIFWLVIKTIKGKFKLKYWPMVFISLGYIVSLL